MINWIRLLHKRIYDLIQLELCSERFTVIKRCFFFAENMWNFLETLLKKKNEYNENFAREDDTLNGKLIKSYL